MKLTRVITKDETLKDIKVYTNKSKIIVILSVDNGLRALSVTCKNRLPTYPEMRELRADLYPEIDAMVEFFPKKEEITNKTKYTRKLWEVKTQKTESNK